MRRGQFFLTEHFWYQWAHLRVSLLRSCVDVAELSCPVRGMKRISAIHEDFHDIPEGNRRVPPTYDWVIMDGQVACLLCINGQDWAPETIVKEYHRWVLANNDHKDKQETARVLAPKAAPSIVLSY